MGGCARRRPTFVGLLFIRYDNPARMFEQLAISGKTKLCQFIKDHELDIVGMQEVLHNQFQGSSRRLARNTMVSVWDDDGRQQVNMRRFSIVRTKYEVLDLILSGW